MTMSVEQDIHNRKQNVFGTEVIMNYRIRISEVNRNDSKITKEFREALYGEILNAYHEKKKISFNFLRKRPK